MTDDETLRPATTEELLMTLSHALRYRGRKQIHYADAMMAGFMAEHLVACLEQSLYVVMKKPPAQGHDNPGHKWPPRMS